MPIVIDFEAIKNKCVQTKKTKRKKSKKKKKKKANSFPLLPH